MIGAVRIAKEMIMNKDDMIYWLLRDRELDRYRVLGSDRESDPSMEAEWARLNALSYGEIEARYLKSEEIYSISA